MFDMGKTLLFGSRDHMATMHETGGRIMKCRVDA
jgi:hypothetical protein